MIKLAIANYCQECEEFDPEKMGETRCDAAGFRHTDVVVMCKHRLSCGHIAKFIEGIIREEMYRERADSLEED